MYSPEEINELLRLDDDALVTTREAGAVLGLRPTTLNWNRCHAPHRCPKCVVLGKSVVRYRMGDLRAFIAARREG